MSAQEVGRPCMLCAPHAITSVLLRFFDNTHRAGRLVMFRIHSPGSVGSASNSIEFSSRTDVDALNR